MTSDVNIKVLNLVQVMVGAITPNFRKVTIDIAEEITLRFLLEKDSFADREEIDDIVVEFLSLQSQNIEVNEVVIVDNRPIEMISMPGWIVFGRKEYS